MDPVVREAVKVVRDVENLWDKEEVMDYFSELGRRLGFRVVKNYSDGCFRIPCVWMEKGVFATFDAEFGGMKEIVGAASVMDSFGPAVSFLVTKDSERVKECLKRIVKRRMVLIDARERKWIVL